MDIEVKRLDHLGVVSGTIKDLGIIELINELIGKDKREEVSTGECVAAMVLNGLGFVSQPLSLTERFFDKKPLDILFDREDIVASYFNKDKLSKTLDKLYDYGCEQLFYQLSLKACAVASIDKKFNSLDTTSISLTGEYLQDFDEHEIKITHGFSKDKRPDLKQCVHELMVSQDGGVPLMMKSWNGNASDNKIFKERCDKLLNNFKQADSPKYLIADSKLYTSQNSANLNKINFITSVPNSIKKVQELIISHLDEKEAPWQKISVNERYLSIDVEHYNINQRWIIVESKQAQSRASKRIAKAVQQEAINYRIILKQGANLFFANQQDAVRNLEHSCSKLKYHTLSNRQIIESHQDGEVRYSAVADLSLSESNVARAIKSGSCFIIASNIAKDELSDEETICAYKNQNTAIENMGFRFLKDPKFFAQSFYLKKPSRIEALLLIMTISLLVYSIAQRNLRKALDEQDKTLPDQINRPTKKPTLRWIFQLLDNINVLYCRVEQSVKVIFEGIQEQNAKILSMFSKNIRLIYGLG
jgi:transposase